MRVIALLILLVLFWTGCEQEPRKSQYMRAAVKDMCGDKKGQDKQTCRLMVMRRYAHATAEDMKKEYPNPPPIGRSSCAHQS